MAHKRLPLLVEPTALALALDTPGLLILDLCDQASFEAAHLPGAAHIAYRDLLRQEGDAKGMIADTNALSRVLSAAGMRADRHIIAYDDEGNGRASRLLWTLEALGHYDYSLLDGGLGAWRAEGLATESGPVTATSSKYHAHLANPEVIADKDYILEHLQDDNTLILDARSPAEYRGEDARAARGGHIPGALNLDWAEVRNPAREGRLYPVETLRTLFKQRGITPDREIITHCQTHHRSALTFFVMRYLGYPSIRGYDGSWSEWGNTPELPVETGDGG